MLASIGKPTPNHWWHMMQYYSTRAPGWGGGGGGGGGGITGYVSVSKQSVKVVCFSDGVVNIFLYKVFFHFHRTLGVPQLTKCLFTLITSKCHFSKGIIILSFLFSTITILKNTPSRVLFCRLSDTI